MLAEREGFEPSRRFPAYTLSRRAPSTTRPPLLASLLDGAVTDWQGGAYPCEAAQVHGGAGQGPRGRRLGRASFFRAGTHDLAPCQSPSGRRLDWVRAWSAAPL